jgi:hypothetical protein
MRGTSKAPGVVPEEDVMRLSFFFKLCALFVQPDSPKALRALMWASHRA